MAPESGTTAQDQRDIFAQQAARRSTMRICDSTMDDP